MKFGETPSGVSRNQSKGRQGISFPEFVSLEDFGRYIDCCLSCFARNMELWRVQYYDLEVYR